MVQRKSTHDGCQFLHFQEMQNNKKTAPLVEKIRANGYDGKRLLLGQMSGPFWSCKFAKECAASAVPMGANGRPIKAIDFRNAERWKIINGVHQKFRCYAASEEVIFGPLRELLICNTLQLRFAEEQHPDAMALLIGESLDRADAYDNRSVVRLHPNGDFASVEQLHAWLQVMRDTPSNRYYLYTKSVQWMLDARTLGLVPDNLSVTYSRGGTQDHLIDLHGLKESVVVASEEEAAAMGLEVDHDDSHALFGSTSFALVVHGAGTAPIRKRGQLALAPVGDMALAAGD